MKVKLSVGAVVGVILCVCVGVAVRGNAKSQSGAPPQAMAASGPKTAVQQFKNIQVLKDIPADELIPTMQFVAASLGVECEFCHVQGAFEKDDKKPKQTARKMMEMMLTINQENFDGHREVTCYSCHRGSTNPAAMPPVMSAEMGMSASARGNAEPEGAETKIVGGPTGNELLEKYLRADGGSAAIDQVNTRVMNGTITFGDRNIPIDIYSKEPDERISFVHTPDGDSITAFNGHEGWLAAPKRPAHEMHGPDIDGAAMDADLHFPAHLKEICSKTEVRGMEKIDEAKAYLVNCERAKKTALHLYFDEKSGLLVRLVRFGETALGQLPTQIDYADYREIGGVNIPYRWTLARPGGRFTIQLSEVKQNVPVEDAKFAKPPAPPEEPKAPTK
jgi:photosynthetic reaction center cytochrome c subunit